MNIQTRPLRLPMSPHSLVIVLCSPHILSMWVAQSRLRPLFALGGSIQMIVLPYKRWHISGGKAGCGSPPGSVLSPSSVSEAFER